MEMTFPEFTIRYSDRLNKDMQAHNAKTARNSKIIRRHDMGISMRAIAEELRLSVSVIHNIYWREKMRAGETRGVPKQMKKKFPQFRK